MTAGSGDIFDANPDDASSDRLRELAAELGALNEALNAAEVDRYYRWQVRVGPVRLAGQVGSQRLGWLFIAFHGLAGSVGIACFFLPGAFPGLGAALVVGSLFGFGAFLAQAWTRQMEREEGRTEDEYRQLLSEIEQRRQKVEKRLLKEIRKLDRRGDDEGP